MGIHFRVLGAVEADVDGRSVDLGAARQRCVLAALLVDAGRVVPTAVLLDRVWAGRAPNRARTTLSGYISRLRHILSAAPEVVLAHRGDGYRLDVDVRAVDLHRFRQLVTTAGSAGEHAEELFAEALDLWRGEAFATLDTPWLGVVRGLLDAERLAAELDRNDLALERGRHAALLPHLAAAAVENPLNERLAGQHMLALYRGGRQADALRQYQQLRQRLAEELGADPNPSLQELHRRILTADRAVSLYPGQPRVPRQLPAPVGSFTGRMRERNRLDALLPGADTPRSMGIAVVSGTAGVGKTALALHWAHRVADRFADGQLYVNLRGFDPGGPGLDPADAIRGFLDAFDVPPQRIPAGLDAQAALYRSLLADRRVLVVLDNARDVGQIRPLLPGSPGCVVVVTSRNQLTSLLAGHGAHRLTLDVLSTQEAHALLADRIGAYRTGAEPDAVEEIIARCARLPLALAIAAANALAQPSFPLAGLAAELRDNPLDALADSDALTDPRAAFARSYRTLGAAAARLFRLLGLHPDPDLSAAAAAVLTGLPIARVRPLLTELTRANLLAEHVPGRYRCHDLLRAYAAELADRHNDAIECPDVAGQTPSTFRRTSSLSRSRSDGASAMMRPSASR